MVSIQNIKIPASSKIIVIEGIPGSGKTTFQQHIVKLLGQAGRLVYEFNEEDLLFSWKHAWLPHIDKMRLELYRSILMHVEETTNRDPQAIFVLDRFHVSLLFYSIGDVGQSDQYKEILNNLKTFNTQIFILVVSDQNIAQRAFHFERKNPLWQKHLSKRLQSRGFEEIGDMYKDEQVQVAKIVKEHGITHSFVEMP